MPDNDMSSVLPPLAATNEAPALPPNKDLANPTGMLCECLGQGCVVCGAVVVGGDDVYGVGRGAQGF